jgi:hypothetical protein
MENTTPFTAKYGGCFHNCIDADRYAAPMVAWIEAGMPESDTFRLHHADMDFGGWVIHLHIQMPDGSIFTTK